MAVDMLAFIEEKLAVSEVDEFDTVGHVDQNIVWLQIFVAHLHFVMHLKLFLIPLL
jgi:hypothetical protein